MPHHFAMEVALTGELREAEFWQHHGIVNRIASPGAALAHAMLLAQALLRNGLTALNATNKSCNVPGIGTKRRRGRSK